MSERRQKSNGSGRKLRLIRLLKTAYCTPVTSRANWQHPNKDGIGIAIDMQTDDGKKVTATFSLGPETIFRAREKSDATLAPGLRPSFLVQVAQHEHLSSIGILYNGRHKASDRIKTQLTGSERGKYGAHKQKKEAGKPDSGDK